MGLPKPDDLVKPFGDCLKNTFNKPEFSFPQIGEPGMPPILMGAIGAMLGPAAPIVKFLPVPKPDAIKDIQKLLTNLPSIVVEGFTGNAKGLPMIPIEIPGVGKISVGEVALPEASFNPKSLIDFVTALITAPINIFKGILESLIKLQPKFPDLNMIIDILKKGFEAVGIPGDVIVGMVTCLAKMFMEVIKGLLP